ncbi:sn-glycerol-3-phosphate ABC transporter substrate-binding protein UgpB [Hydrogenophaga sp.]|uniref:sn-glycerol-3-phosphate ABC transporter substrate-binding protein UgpB n=1 Tax=Hydrogenophaga sp. TaxID=1904254 RepID=UPI0019BD5801|nr:sn-glycerol-3-phosphate ABC transporter substrate-binding protein UgpB [Hydrogenophaga sp.]MBD3893096.1 sn-glycerol-3-phosphate ABC transporter substrate-binding protein UgpB [Hydrogenophaga sp.]
MKRYLTRLAQALALSTALAGTAQAQAPAPAPAPTEIQFWMGLTGVNGQLLSRFGEDFNRTQNEYRVVVSFKGQYPEQRAAAVAAYRAGNPPHIMQMFDAGSGDMMAAREAIVPVSEVFRRAGLQFNPADFIAPARGYYGLPNGDLLSMPFNVSTTVLFYNKDAFARAGLNPEQPPRTWPELVAAAQKIRSSNAADCGFTTTWLAWVMLEQFSSRHNLAFGTRDNGRAGLDAALQIANSPLHIKMVQTLADMQKDKRFVYGGRSNDAAAKFISGECAMMTQSSGGLGAITQGAKFNFGVGQLPHWPEVRGAPYATTIGGASLWVFNAPNRSEREFRGVAQFLNFLRSDRVMTEWAKTTGFLPATNSAFKAMQDEGFFTQNPGRDVPILSLIQARQGAHTNGYRFGRWTEIRDVYHEEVERVLQGRQSARDAMRNFERRGNALLRAFERTARTAN